jgi:hypothetical protein
MEAVQILDLPRFSSEPVSTSSENALGNVWLPDTLEFKMPMSKPSARRGMWALACTPALRH